MGKLAVFAVFPLSRIVAFPGHILQLHVFEPRYRKMLQDCLEQKTQIGVALGRPAGRSRLPLANSIEAFLSSNQENYHPEKVFGVGTPKVLRTFDDGRSMIEVKIERKVHIQEIVQHIPYLKVIGRYHDDINPPHPQLEQDYIEVLVESLQKTLGEKSHFLSEVVTSKSTQPKPGTLSRILNEVLRWVVFEPHEHQRLLEEQDVLERTEEFLRLLHQHTSIETALDESVRR